MGQLGRGSSAGRRRRVVDGSSKGLSRHGGKKEVEIYSDAVLTEYFGEYSPTAKPFLITGGRSEAFKDFAGFAAQWMLLQSNPTAVTKVRGSVIIAGWENRALDWAAITSAALIREATANQKYRASALAYWLGMFYTPPPGKERPGSRQRDQRTPEEEAGSKRKEPAKAVVPVEDAAEQKRDPAKGKAPLKEKPRPKEIWEVGTSGTSPEPEPSPEDVAEKPRRR
jgi:hypothetical protein